MHTQYYCRNKGRRQKVLDHPSLNGIDYLEVLDRAAPSDSLRQRTLLIRCLKEVPPDITAKNVRIEGGVRVKSIGIEWAYPAKYITDHLTAHEKGYLDSLPSPELLLVVRTDSRGDFSTYRFLLVQSSSNSDPPEGFDPLLSEIEFSFKIECPSEFDCKSEALCPSEIFPQPNIDYLAKDYASFRRLILDRLSIIMPDWKERSPADLGIMLVELLAFAGDYLSYYQDSVATEAYLGTARRRVSLRRHARLLDYYMHDGCNSRVWICIDLGEGSPLALQKWDENTRFRTRFLTRCAEETEVENDDWQELVSTRRPQVFELLHDITLYHSHCSMSFYTWGEEQCCLPKGATRAFLVNGIEEKELHLQAGDVLIFEELLGVNTGVKADADPAHRHAVRLKMVRPLTDPLTDFPIVEIQWHPEDALPFPLCLSALISGRPVNDISCAHGNVVLADHGLTIESEYLHPKAVPATGRYRPRLQRRDITFRATYDHEKALKQSASAAIRPQEAREALPSVSLNGDGDLWTARRDLLSSNRFFPEFVVEIEDDKTAYLRFGDDVLGKRPGPGSSLKASYRVGNGIAGNIGADAISHIVVPSNGRINLVRNPLPAQGGIDREPTAQIGLYAPYAFRSMERAVTPDDYATIVQRHPEVQKAVANLRWTGSWYTIFIYVDRKGGLKVDHEFEEELLAFLERFRLAGHDIEIDAPSFAPLDIAFTVCVAPGYIRENVLKALLEVFSNLDLQDGRRGFFHPDNFTFGQPVYLSRLVAAAMEVSGVLWIDTSDREPHRFRRWGRSSQGEIGDGMIAFAPLEIARLDNDPSSPENGRIDFFMDGGL